MCRLVQLVLCLLALSGRVLADTAFRRRKAPPTRTKKVYDQSVRAFDPSGSIYQVEYASQAVSKGSLALGIQVKRGVVLAACVRKHSPLLKQDSISKLVKVDEHVFCALSGLLPDGRILIEHARQKLEDHWFEYDERLGTEAVAACLSDVMLRFNAYGNGEEEEQNSKKQAFARPLGVGLLLAGWDDDYQQQQQVSPSSSSPAGADVGARGGPSLYSLLPSGSYTRWRARAIGQNSEAAEEKLRELCDDDATIEEAMVTAMGVLERTQGHGPGQSEADFDPLLVRMVVLETPSQQDGEEQQGLGQGKGLPADGGRRRPAFRTVDSEELCRLADKARLQREGEKGKVPST